MKGGSAEGRGGAGGAPGGRTVMVADGNVAIPKLLTLSCGPTDEVNCAVASVSQSRMGVGMDTGAGLGVVRGNRSNGLGIAIGLGGDRSSGSQVYRIVQPSELGAERGEQQAQDTDDYGDGISLSLDFDGEDLLQLPSQQVHARRASALSSIANVANTILGAGILALPYAFAQSGFVLGSFFLLFAAASSAFALHCLSECASKTGLPSSFYSVAKHSVPSYTFLIDLAVAVKCFGVATSYLVVIGDLMPSVVEHVAPLSPHIWLSRSLWICIGFSLCGPLAVFRKLDTLKYTSCLSITFVIFLTAVVVAYRIPELSLDPCGSPHICSGETSLAKFDLQTFKVLPIFIFSFTCQQNIFTVHNELQDSTSRKIDIVIICSIIPSAFVYLAVATAGYSTYGSEVQSDVLNSYPNTRIFTVCRIFVALLVAFSYPLQTHPSRNSFLALWSTAERCGRLICPSCLASTQSRFAVVTFAILCGTLAAALSVNNLGTVLALVGATGSTTVSFILPGICFYQLHRYSEPRAWRTRLALVQFLAGCFIVPMSLTAAFL